MKCTAALFPAHNVTENADPKGYYATVVFDKKYIYYQVIKFFAHWYLVICYNVRTGTIWAGLLRNEPCPVYGAMHYGF